MRRKELKTKLGR